MKSRITVEVDFDRKNEPVIQILFRKSDDVRDNLLQSFLQSLQGQSNWLRIDLMQYCDDPLDRERDFKRYYLSPVTPEKMEQNGKYMLEQAPPYPIAAQS
jgi:hypothetical protein